MMARKGERVPKVGDLVCGLLWSSGAGGNLLSSMTKTGNEEREKAGNHA
jgi:hypothetical protein